MAVIQITIVALVFVLTLLAAVGAVFYADFREKRLRREIVRRIFNAAKTEDFQTIIDELNEISEE